jgi:hypothetical protein
VWTLKTMKVTSYFNLFIDLITCVCVKVSHGKENDGYSKWYLINHEAKKYTHKS